MVLCPIAAVAGCKKCPVFSVCPATKILGDQGKNTGKNESAGKEGSKNGK